jgi:BlaI family transcriptional regulator, penicillinase repressor
VAARRPSGGNTTELEVLKALWEYGPGTVRQVHAHLQAQGCRAAYTTILTHLQRLEAKGYVVSDKREVAHVFRAAVSRDRLLRRRLKDLANELCDGTAAPLLHALVEGRRFKPAEIERFRRLLDELEDETEK